ncbi:MAG: hypothetical protein AAB565_01305 [Patescibacteria group bacterium]
METSIFLAKVIGLLSVISTLAILIRYKKSIAFEEELVKNPSNVYISGFVFLFLGVLIIISHPVWTFDWRVIVTIIGWLIFLKGVGRIFFPEAVKRLIEKKKGSRKFIIGEVVLLIIGLYLLYYGFLVY